MDADDHPVEVVLKEARRFMVPLYQRKYQWGDNRLEPFWEDVSAKAAEVLEGESRFQHYMGALILSPIDQGSQIGVTPLVQVVDGQQRLTTFQIFLAALREVARAHGLDDYIEHVNGYLLNIPKSKDTDPHTKFKLTPTPSDRDLFHDLIEMDYPSIVKKYETSFWGGRVPKNTLQKALRAYYLFHTWIDEFVRQGPSDLAPIMDDGEMDAAPSPEIDNEPASSSDISDRLEALLKGVLDRLKLVVITLGEYDDAQVIFETLNSKGEPLLAMDLVRNNIFHRAEKQKASVEELYKKLWDPLDESWWREAAPNARPRRPRIDHFLAHMLAAETGEKISMRELYAEYRAFAVPKGTPRFEDVEDELKLLEAYSPLYETLEGRREADPALQWLGRKMAAWQVTTVYPVAMQIGRSNLDAGERLKLSELIYSYIARRALCGLTTKNLNKVFQSIAAHFVKSGTTIEAFKNFFDDKEGSSTRFPDDTELRQGVLTGNAYAIAPTPRLVDILWELELATRTPMAEQMDKPANLWIEHVLPQSWDTLWPFQIADDDDAFYEEVEPDSDDIRVAERNRAVHTLGNLTLLTSSLNISAGKNAFETKQDKYDDHTALFLNKWFSVKNMDNKKYWTEADIQKRGNHLADLAANIWIGLESV